MNKDPLTLDPMDVNAVIRNEHLLPVTSMFIMQPSSNEFHPDGLYSEEIFGEVASPTRLVRKAYIELNTKIINPKLYLDLIRLKSGYERIMAGTQYVKFDEKLGDFVESDDEDAKTGYSYFMKYLDKLTFTKNDSLARNVRVELLDKYRNVLLIDKFLVMPAGLRDYDPATSTSNAKELNSMYVALINYSKGIPKGQDNNPLYDSYRYAIQKKALEVFKYFMEFISGKTGWIQKKYVARNLAYGTRNVISSVDTSTNNRKDPQYIKSDETKLPLFQAAKGYQPIVVYFLKYVFLSQIFDVTADQIAAIDKKTLKLTYVEISDKEKDKFLSTDGIVNMLTLFWHVDFRRKPVTVYSKERKPYYLFMVYDDNKEIYHFRNIDEFKQYYQDMGKTFDETKLRPLTYAEMVYVATWRATIDKHCMTTRFPAIGMGSTYPSRVHLTSTVPSRTVDYVSQYNSEDRITLPEYPIQGNDFIDSTMLHPSKLDGLDGDFDGDQVNVDPILSEEANKEVDDYLNSLGSVITPEGKLDMGITSLIKLVVYNLTAPPIVNKKK